MSVFAGLFVCLIVRLLPACFFVCFVLFVRFHVCASGE